MNATSPREVIEFAEGRLATAQKLFADNPNSVHWQEALRAMFIYQQVDYVQRRSSLLDIYALCAAIDKLEEGASVNEWDDAISAHCVGVPILEALQEFAVF